MYANEIEIFFLGMHALLAYHKETRIEQSVQITQKEKGEE